MNEEDQRDTEQHIVHHRTHGDRNEVASIVIGLDPDPRRQAAVVVDARDGCADARHDVHRPLELLHQDDAEKNVVLVVAGGNPKPRGIANLVACDVGQHDGQSALLAHHDIVDVADRAQHADAAHIDRLFTDRDRPAADIGIAGGDRIDDLAAM